MVACPSVSVVFPGAVSRESCCRFACEFLKHVLHQRHQLPLPYEQLAYFCRRAAQVRGPWARGGAVCVCGESLGPGCVGGKSLGPGAAVPSCQAEAAAFEFCL